MSIQGQWSPPHFLFVLVSISPDTEHLVHRASWEALLWTVSTQRPLSNWAVFESKGSFLPLEERVREMED